MARSSKLCGAVLLALVGGASVAGEMVLHEEELSWTAAEAACVAEGGHLASIHSDEEQAARFFCAHFFGIEIIIFFIKF